MRVIILQSMAGNGFTREVGQEYDIPEKEALRLIEAGIAREVIKAKPKKPKIKNVTLGKRSKR